MNGTLCWLFKDSPASTIAELTHALGAEGAQFNSIQVVATSQATQEWLLERVPSTSNALLLVSRDLNWVGEVTKCLREMSSSTLRFLPVIWIYDALETQTVDRLSDLGVDDAFPVSMEPLDFMARISLRLKESHARVRMDAQLKEQSTRIAKSETTLKQREEFLSVCAHDLRSPLGLIQSSLSMILNAKGGATVPPFYVELLTRAKRQAGHAITLVNDLLDVMAFEQGLKPQYQLLNPHEFLNEFYKDYSFQAEQKGIKFHYENPLQDWRILADADRIRQLLQNLFTNALKFTESGKNIYLTVMPFTGRRKSDPAYPMMIISLRDEGKGIPASEMQKIFDRFTQIKDYSRSEGRGLGLTVAKQISTLHDGNIWVQSVEGEGSTFFVLFPHVISRSAANQKNVRIKKYWWSSLRFRNEKNISANSNPGATKLSLPAMALSA